MQFVFMPKEVLWIEPSICQCQNQFVHVVIHLFIEIQIQFRCISQILVFIKVKHIELLDFLLFHTWEGIEISCDLQLIMVPTNIGHYFCIQNFNLWSVDSIACHINLQSHDQQRDDHRRDDYHRSDKGHDNRSRDYDNRHGYHDHQRSDDRYHRDDRHSGHDRYVLNERFKKGGTGILF